MPSCRMCGVEQTLENSYPDRSKRRGFNSYCKDCTKVWKASYYAVHGERLRAAWRAYAASHKPEAAARYKAWVAANPERWKAYQRAWAKANDFDRQAARRYRANNPESAKAAQRKYRRANPHVAALGTKRRRARLAGAIATLTRDEWFEILEFFDHRCAYCLDRLTQVEVDHVIAVARGGEHTAENVVPACRRCNGSKGDRPIFWMVNGVIGDATARDAARVRGGVQRGPEEGT